MVALIIFDVDGTLAEAYTLNLLPGVAVFFELVLRGGCLNAPKVSLATNQGGVGMRYWMETARFGKPKQFPTEKEIEDRINRLLEALTGVVEPTQQIPVYVSYRYRDKRGRLAPVPPGQEKNPRWQESWRKPLPGMLLQAMADAGVTPEMTLFVGDSEDDQEAASAAGCAFAWAGEFFSRRWESCEDWLYFFGN